MFTTEDRTEVHLSDSEKVRLLELEEEIELAKSAYEQAAFIMGEALAEISRLKLYRETHKRFGDYVLDRFGITREYAHDILKTSSYRKIAIGELGLNESYPFSVNTWITFKRAINKIGKQFGISGKAIEGQLQDIMRQSLKILCDLAPKENNVPVVTPQLMNFFFEAVNDHLDLQTININGQQLTLEEAKNKGLQANIVALAQKNILLNEEIIKSNTINRKESKVITDLPIETDNQEFEIEHYSEGKKDTEIAEVRVAEYLRAMDDIIDVKSVGVRNLGYDLEVLFNNGRKIYVEVKSVKTFSEQFRLTQREHIKANEYKKDYYIAIIVNNEMGRIRFISDPLSKMRPEEVIQTIFYQFNKYSKHLEDEL
ncbi:MAG: DUF3883 domain-containing protein [Acidobacteriota bacterium]